MMMSQANKDKGMNGSNKNENVSVEEDKWN